MSSWPKEKTGRPQLLLAEVERIKAGPDASDFRHFPTIEFCRHFVRLKQPKMITASFVVQCLTAYQKHREACDRDAAS